MPHEEPGFRDPSRSQHSSLYPTRISRPSWSTGGDMRALKSEYLMFSAGETSGDTRSTAGGIVAAGGGRGHVGPNEVRFTELVASADLAWRGWNECAPIWSRPSLRSLRITISFSGIGIIKASLFPGSVTASAALNPRLDSSQHKAPIGSGWCMTMTDPRLDAYLLSPRCRKG